MLPLVNKMWACTAPQVGASYCVMSIADTIRVAREKLDISQSELARRVGVTKTAVSKWEKGDSAPTRKRAAKVARELGLRPEDLQEHSRVGFTLLDDKGRERMIPLLTMGEFLSIALTYDETDFTVFPSISADVPQEAESFALRVDSDEMAGDVNPGDVLVCVRNITPRDGDLVFALVGHGLLFRRYRSRGSDSIGRQVFDLTSPNPEIATQTINAANPGRLLAVVIEHRKRRAA